MFNRLDDNKCLDIFKVWYKNTEIPLLISGVEGEIFDCNPAFEKFIKYSDYELTIGESGKGLSWFQISVDDNNLKADKQLALECVNGDRISYSIKKQYIPKNESPIWVDLNVIRYPAKGPFEFFLVSVIPMKNGSLAAFNLSMDKMSHFTNALIKIDKDFRLIPEVMLDYIKNNTKPLSELEKFGATLGRLANENPKISGLIVLVMSIMLLGNQLVTAIETIKQLIGW